MSLSPPRGMSLEARQVCRKLAPELEYEGTLTPANRGDFAQYCVEVLATRRAAALVNGNGDEPVPARPAGSSASTLTGPSS